MRPSIIQDSVPVLDRIEESLRTEGPDVSQILRMTGSDREGPQMMNALAQLMASGPASHAHGNTQSGGSPSVNASSIGNTTSQATEVMKEAGAVAQKAFAAPDSVPEKDPAAKLKPAAQPAPAPAPKPAGDAPVNPAAKIEPMDSMSRPDFHPALLEYIDNNNKLGQKLGLNFR